MTPRQLLPALRDGLAVLGPHVTYASAYVRRDGGTQVRCDSQGAVASPVQPRAGFTLTAWRGGRVFEYSCDDARPMQVAHAARRLAMRLAACGLPKDGPAPRPIEGKDEHRAQTSERSALSVPVAEKIELARALRASLVEREARLVETIAMVGDIHAEVLFVDAGRAVSQELHRVRQVALGIFTDKGKQAQLHHGFERIGGWEHMDLQSREWDEMLRDGVRIVGAPRIPDAGRHACVFSPEFAGIFAHEAFGHGTEQDMFRKRRARGAEYMGKAVASPKVCMYDDPSNGWAAGYFFDDEGVPATCTTIIDHGQLVAGLNDQHSAEHLAVGGALIAKTANGRREAYDHKVYARMTNTFFGAGEARLEDMIASVEHGYFLHHPSNGMEDPKGWGIQLEGAYAERIKDGALTGQVYSPVVVTGYVPDLLQSISMVGADVHECSLGMCGKGYKEWVKVTDGGPALRLEAVIA